MSKSLQIQRLRKRLADYELGVSSKVVQIEQLATELIEKHIPDKGYSFVWGNKIHALGTCNYTYKQIILSKRWCLKLPIEEVTDTILHEIAHALNPGDGHGNKWKLSCVLIGAKPNATADEVDIPISEVAIPKYQMVAPDGTVVKNYYRKPSRKTYKKLPYTWQRNNKKATYGKLRIIATPLIDTL